VAGKLQHGEGNEKHWVGQRGKALKGQVKESGSTVILKGKVGKETERNARPREKLKKTSVLRFVGEKRCFPRGDLKGKRKWRGANSLAPRT